MKHGRGRRPCRPSIIHYGRSYLCAQKMIAPAGRWDVLGRSVDRGSVRAPNHSIDRAQRSGIHVRSTVTWRMQVIVRTCTDGRPCARRPEERTHSRERPRHGERNRPGPVWLPCPRTSPPFTATLLLSRSSSPSSHLICIHHVAAGGDRKPPRICRRLSTSPGT
jgi:hypothetical protein